MIAKTIEEAEEFFLRNATEGIMCVVGNTGKVCSSYPEAKKFFEEVGK